MRREIKWPVIFLLLLTNCSPGNEVVMPFRNLAYSVDRLLPLKTSSSDFSFRIWISNSTSIYRVISISRDTVYDYSKKVIVAKDSSFEFNGYLTEIGRLHKGKKSKEYYKQIEIEPKSGYAEFKNEIDKLNLLALSSQEKPIPIALHQPFSTYVVEIMVNKQYNLFKFDSPYPNQDQYEEKYAAIEKLIFSEFNIYDYFKFKK